MTKIDNTKELERQIKQFKSYTSLITNSLINNHGRRTYIARFANFFEIPNLKKIKGDFKVIEYNEDYNYFKIININTGIVFSIALITDEKDQIQTPYLRITTKDLDDTIITNDYDLLTHLKIGTNIKITSGQKALTIAKIKNKKIENTEQFLTKSTIEYEQKVGSNGYYTYKPLIVSNELTKKQGTTTDYTLREDLSFNLNTTSKNSEPLLSNDSYTYDINSNVICGTERIIPENNYHLSAIFFKDPIQNIAKYLPINIYENECEEMQKSPTTSFMLFKYFNQEQTIVIVVTKTDKQIKIVPKHITASEKRKRKKLHFESETTGPITIIDIDCIKHKLEDYLNDEILSKYITQELTRYQQKISKNPIPFSLETIHNTNIDNLIEYIQNNKSDIFTTFKNLYPQEEITQNKRYNLTD